MMIVDFYHLLSEQNFPVVKLSVTSFSWLHLAACELFGLDQHRLQKIFQGFDQLLNIIHIIGSIHEQPQAHLDAAPNLWACTQATAPSGTG